MSVVTCGVPQGSTLGPLHFQFSLRCMNLLFLIIFVHLVAAEQTENTTMSHFIDDDANMLANHLFPHPAVPT